MVDECKQRWYLSQSPWFKYEHIGTNILAGSADPHIGVVVLDTLMFDPCDEDDDDAASDRALLKARAVAKHIVDIHNAGLDNSAE